MSLLKMSPSPHNKSDNSTRRIMLCVLIALAPSLVWSCFMYGFRPLVLTIIAIGSAVGFEALCCLIMKKKQSVGDLSAAVTGMLIAFNIPAAAPLWLPVMGSLFAIVVVKMLFGGLGKNIVNPALAARVFMMLSWTDAFVYTASRCKLPVFAITVPTADAISSATPLAKLKEGIKAGAVSINSDNLIDYFLGNMGGCIGEISAILLIAGGLYLIFVANVITWHIPTAYIGTVALITFLLPRGTSLFNVEFMLYNLLTGGLMLGAFFMATDYATSPVTKGGRLIYGVGCGLITVLIRYFGGYPEGVSFSILIMNLLVWYLDRLTMPVPFGGSKK